jgi:carboxymethylenebutenolidase
MREKSTLRVAGKELNDVWDEHLRAELRTHSADEALATMSGNPLVSHAPVMTGGEGKEELHDFYSKYFLPQIPIWR